MADNMMNCYLTLFLIFVLALARADDDHGANVIAYDAETFAASLVDQRNFVMFYAPWCGHCKNLSPTWDELAKVHNKDDKSPVIIAKVDCTIHTSLCAEHEIVGFPTLKLFDVGGTSHKRYTGKRDLDSLKAFILEHVPVGNGEDVPKTAEDEPEVPEQKEELITLTDENFDAYLKKGGGFFVKFYAPWCGHCKKLAPVWEELAESFSKLPKVNIAKIDCTKSTVVCDSHNIRGYPTLLWFYDGEMKKQFQDARSLEVLKSFVEERMKEAESGDKHVEKENEGEVLELTVDNFKSIMADNELIFIKFYAPWCGHCKRLAPTWDDLAKKFADENVGIAKVDCTQHKSVCDEYQVRGYPTLKMFRNGEVVNDYRGPRALEDLSGYVKKYMGKEEAHDEL